MPTNEDIGKKIYEEIKARKTQGKPLPTYFAMVRETRDFSGLDLKSAKDIVEGMVNKYRKNLKSFGYVLREGYPNITLEPPRQQE